MNTKLILVEGLPGSGKSTTAELVNQILTDMGKETAFFREGNLDHPADYDGVAFLSESEFDHLITENKDYKELLIGRAIKKANGFFFKYRKLKNELGPKFPDDLVNTISQYDIYELPLDSNIELITDRWQSFVNTALNDDKTYIFECCFIQNPITMAMVKYDAPNEISIDYVMQLAKTIEPLNPILVYVDQSDIEASFKKAVADRSKEWSDGFSQYYTKQGYGKKFGYIGIEGTIKVLQARKELEEEIFEQLELKKQRIDNSEFNKETHKSKLIDLLNSEFSQV